MFYKMRYDYIHKVVDDSEFQPDSELVRSAKFAPSGGDGSTPLYDYPDGNVPENDKVSKLILQIRTGKLDRADVDRIKEVIIEEAKSDTVKAENKALLDAVKSTFMTDKKEGENSN